MRSHLTDERERPPLGFIVTAAASGLALFALAIAASEERAITASISAGIVAGVRPAARLRLAAADARGTIPPHQASVSRACAREHRRTWLDRPPSRRLARAWARLPRRHRADRPLAAWPSSQDNIEVEAPAYYFLDVDAQDLAAFRDTAKAVEPDAKLADAPMLRGRIVAINGVPVEKVEAAPDSRWVLASDRGLTYADKLPQGSTITQGRMVGAWLHRSAARLLRRRFRPRARA